MFSIDNQLVKAPGTILPHILAILLTGFLGLVGGETPEAAAAAMTTQDQDEVPATEEIFYQRGVDYLGRFRKDDIGQAVRLFNRVVKTDPRNPQGHAGLAEARAIQYLLGWE